MKQQSMMQNKCHSVNHLLTCQYVTVNSNYTAVKFQNVVLRATLQANCSGFWLSSMSYPNKNISSNLHLCLDCNHILSRTAVFLPKSTLQLTLRPRWDYFYNAVYVACSKVRAYGCFALSEGNFR